MNLMQKASGTLGFQTDQLKETRTVNRVTKWTDGFQWLVQIAGCCHSERAAAPRRCSLVVKAQTQSAPRPAVNFPSFLKRYEVIQRARVCWPPYIDFRRSCQSLLVVTIVTWRPGQTWQTGLLDPGVDCVINGFGKKNFSSLGLVFRLLSNTNEEFGNQNNGKNWAL